ncbi:MAG: hypothetical protein QF464_02915 [Myxococcota bacterium]|nr:hypothetical protein [Myxococcota bacterium]
MGITVLFVFVGGLVWGRCVLSEGRQAETLHIGATALDQALSGDDTAWPRAEKAYGHAARGSLLDAYPLWVLELIRAWRLGEPAGGPGPLGTVLEAVRTGDHQGARSGLAKLAEPKARELAERLLDDLRSARDRRTTAPVNSK